LGLHAQPPRPGSSRTHRAGDDGDPGTRMSTDGLYRALRVRSACGRAELQRGVRPRSTGDPGVRPGTARRLRTSARGPNACGADAAAVLDPPGAGGAIRLPESVRGRRRSADLHKREALLARDRSPREGPRSKAKKTRLARRLSPIGPGAARAERFRHHRTSRASHRARWKRGAQKHSAAQGTVAGNACALVPTMRCIRRCSSSSSERPGTAAPRAVRARGAGSGRRKRQDAFLDGYDEGRARQATWTSARAPKLNGLARALHARKKSGV